jgi:Fe/S biogenesis protein NfuA
MNSDQAKESLLVRIKSVLDEAVAPHFMEHSGNIEIVSVDDGVCRVRLLGACANCPSAFLDTEEMIKEPIMTAFPEIRNVVLIQETNPELLSFAYKLLRHEISGETP